MNIIFSIRREDKFWKIMLFVLTSYSRSVRLLASPGSSAFAAGQLRRQVRPEEASLRFTVPSTLCSAMASITMVPNPRRSGGETSGPSASIPLMAKVLPSVRQQTLTRL
jgi:hypothetical protein